MISFNFAESKREGPQKVKNSMLFHIFPDTVADNGWKNHMSSNFVFSELKNGGSKAGVPVETPKGSRWGVPLLETPIFQRENSKF